MRKIHFIGVTNFFLEITKDEIILLLKALYLSVTINPDKSLLTLRRSTIASNPFTWGKISSILIAGSSFRLGEVPKQINVSEFQPLDHSGEHHSDLPLAQVHIYPDSFG